MTTKTCDIVLEGGGVKGIGLVGALEALGKEGYSFQRVAGTSAGSIVGSLLAAGMTPTEMAEELKHIDYEQFQDPSLFSRFGWPGKGLSLLLTKGIYQGDYLHTWLEAKLASLGVRTFADLRLREPWAEALPPERRYKLVIIVSDVTRGRLVRFPWDYEQYGLNPDEQLVADAVRASMSIPYFYQPAKLKGSFLVDGGLLSNFPIDSFDDTADWPTFGIKLSAKEEALTTMHPVTNPINYTLNILDTITNAHDRLHLDNPCTIKRTMFVDTASIKATDFNIKPAQQLLLYQTGQEAAAKFLSTWDYANYKAVCPV